MTSTPKDTRIEEMARDFCRNTSRLKEESGVAFYERLVATLTSLTQESYEAGREFERNEPMTVEQYEHVHRDCGERDRLLRLIEEVEQMIRYEMSFDEPQVKYAFFKGAVSASKNILRRIDKIKEALQGNKEV